MNKFGFFSEGAKGVVRNGFRSIASILILSSSLLLVGIFLTVITVINVSIDSIDDFKEIVVYMDLDADKETVQKAEQDIKNLVNVKSVSFIAKKDALLNEKDKFGEKFAYVFDSYDDKTNPLPDSFRIEYECVEDIDALVYNLEHLDGVDQVKSRYDIAKTVENVKNAISVGGTWLMVLLIAVSVFVISNTIRLTYHAREREITVMRYIGATKSYITLPFIVEGAIIGLLSGILGYIIQCVLFKIPLQSFAAKAEGFITVPAFAEFNVFYLLIFFGAGIILGVIGSAMAIRKYLKA